MARSITLDRFAWPLLLLPFVVWLALVVVFTLTEDSRETGTNPQSQLASPSSCPVSEVLSGDSIQVSTDEAMTTTSPTRTLEPAR